MAVKDPAASDLEGETASEESSTREFVGHTRHDVSDMQRMGKEQRFRRNFHQFASISLTSICMSTWQVIFIANTQGLNSGGLAGLFWSYVWTFFGFGAIIASLAEMASMAPCAGGQYHWVSEFAPKQYQRFLSYLTGWMSTLSWQACNASGPFLNGTMIQAIVAVNNPRYSGTGWQGTLLVWALTIPLWLGNTYFAGYLPQLNQSIIVIYIGSFVVIVAILWALGPRNSADQVFLEFTNLGGWSSVGLSVMVGQISAIWALICSDSAVHMGEETTEASLTVPRSMWWAYVSNGLMGLVFLISMLFAIPSVADAVNDPSGYPFLYILRTTFPESSATVTGVTILILTIGIGNSIVFTASTSRQAFAFARDQGLPFSEWIAHVHPTLRVPVNAVTVSCVIAAALALINIGSTAAFNAIISLNLVSLLLTYILAIGCVLNLRVQGPQALPPARWSLGRAAIPINGLAFVYCIFAFFWCFWPNVVDPGLEEFNWSVAIFLAVFTGALVLYWVGARHRYQGPVKLVMDDQDMQLNDK